MTINSRQNIGVPINGVDAIAFGGGDEREMDGDSAGALIRACEERIFSYQNPAFNGPLGRIIVYGDFGILEKSGKCEPVFEGVIDSFHQFVSGMKLDFCMDNSFSQKLNKRLRFAATHGQSNCLRFIFNVALDSVEVAVNIENIIAEGIFWEGGFEVLASRMGAASGFCFGAILKEGIEAAGSVGLNNTVKVFEKLRVFVERQIRREIEHCHTSPLITDVGCNFAFPYIIFVFAVLDLDRGIVSFNEAGAEQFSFHRIVKNGERVSGELHPIALCGTGNDDAVAGKDLLLTIIRQAIIKLTDDDFAQEARTGKATRNRRTGLFRSSNELLAIRTSASFLMVFEDFQAGADHLELICDEVANEDGFNSTLGTDGVLCFYWMHDWLVRQIFGVFENMLNTGGVFIFRDIGLLRLLLCLNGGRSRIMLFRLTAVVALVALFRLSYQLIELDLQAMEQFAQFFIAMDGLLELLLQTFNERGEALNLGDSLEVFFFPCRRIIIHGAPSLVSMNDAIIHYTL